MKRSEINAIMREGIDFLRENKFHLPPFAFWSPEECAACEPDSQQIVAQQLGWDITDFGAGDFARLGLLLFTIRNGTTAELENPLGKTYGEKLLIVQPGQITPTHFHYQKMEDIINRGGGNLVVQLWNSTPDSQLEKTQVTVYCDGIKRTVSAGGTITLTPGESVCLPQRLYHKFWGEKGKGTVLVGEVSRVNDDRTDNHFHEKIGRFPAIEEDEQPLHLLTIDYSRYFKK